MKRIGSLVAALLLLVIIPSSWAYKYSFNSFVDPVFGLPFYREWIHFELYTPILFSTSTVIPGSELQNVSINITDLNGNNVPVTITCVAVNPTLSPYIAIDYDDSAAPGAENYIFNQFMFRYNFDHATVYDSLDPWKLGLLYALLTITDTPAPVPEPSTFILAFIGAVGLAGYGRKRLK